MAASLQMYLSKIRSPSEGEKVYKDECVFSFDTPVDDMILCDGNYGPGAYGMDSVHNREPEERSRESATGLYICMNTFMGFGRDHVMRHFEKTGNAVYLHMCRTKRQLPKVDDDTVRSKPTKLAIGIEGGFNLDEHNYEVEETNTIVVMPSWKDIPLTDPELPVEVQISVAAIVATDSAAQQEELQALSGAWDGEKRVISRHADTLIQLDRAGQKIPPSGWKCEQCEMTENLWLNLTDGSILCGRKFWDGSGGNNHAVEHYEQVKHPLAVKLGTITPDGGDVYSYEEDDMVEDPHLAVHLAHFGIDVMSMQKTEKTMVELEIELNQRLGEWDVIQEAGCKLQPVYGPGYTGMHNLGNSCYMNSVMQVIFTLPDFQHKYFARYDTVISRQMTDPVGDFTVQMSKLAYGLLSGKYSMESPAIADSKDAAIVIPQGIRPQMFKSLIGRGHPEFSTKRQQDAQEFILHLLNMTNRDCHGREDPTECLRFRQEERIECVKSKKVNYVVKEEYILALPIALDAATNKEELLAYEMKKKEQKPVNAADIVYLRVPLSACIDSYAAPEIIEDFHSTALQARSTAKKTSRLASFPDYLFIQLKKFTIGEDWVPKKLDVAIDIPDVLDLSALRGTGIQPGEEELPTTVTQKKEIQLDESLVRQLVEMGFPLEGCRKGVYHTGNSGIEAAMNWVMEHMNDPDFEVPLVISSDAATTDNFTVNEDAIAMLSSMGFTRDQAIKALKATDNNLERAADWIFSHAAELEQPMDTDQSSSETTPRSTCRDGATKYQLVAFISHMGTSTMVGHYVCHILKDGRWVIFNDEKARLSEHPPKELGYLYLYKRL